MDSYPAISPKGLTVRQQRIREALITKGYAPTCIEWEPVGGMVEMQGRSGGWFVYFEPEDLDEPDHFIGGFSVDEVLEQIAELPNAADVEELIGEIGAAE